MQKEEPAKERKKKVETQPPASSSSKSLVLCCWSFNGNFTVQTLNECSSHRKEEH